MERTRPSFVEVVNFLGSLASVTGVSLLWLKGEREIDLGTILAISLSASGALGLASLFAWALIAGYKRYLDKTSVMLKIAYFTLGIPAIFFVGLLIALSANKLVISVDWFWFLRG